MLRHKENTLSCDEWSSNPEGVKQRANKRNLITIQISGKLISGHQTQLPLYVVPDNVQARYENCKKTRWESSWEIPSFPHKYFSTLFNNKQVIFSQRNLFFRSLQYVFWRESTYKRCWFWKVFEHKREMKINSYWARKSFWNSHCCGKGSLKHVNAIGVSYTSLNPPLTRNFGRNFGHDFEILHLD